MTDKEQIEEIAKVIEVTEKKKMDSHCDLPSVLEYATDLYNAGYRKQSDVAREIFEEIEEHIDKTAFADCWSEGGFRASIAELKKKYTEGQ